MAQKPSIPQGTRDFLPEVMIRRERIFDTIRQVFRKYGYAPIETPAMEKLSVLTGKYGEEGDKLIFKILNNGDFLRKAKDLDDSQKLSFQICDRALRYDLTVPFARFVVMNRNELNFPFKRYQIQPVWRGDRPGKGRYREFYQCDADVVGSDSLLFEAEYICMFDEVLSNLGLPGFSVLLNNRKILGGYAEIAGQPDKLTDICTAIDKLDKIGEEGVRKDLAKRGIGDPEADRLFELIRFEGTNEEKLDFLEKAFENSLEGLEGVREIREVFRYLNQFELNRATVTLDLPLARGLDYYTGTIFEVKAHDVSIGSICGGGRYSDLTGVFGLKDMPGVGISFGADRIYDAMAELGLFEEAQHTTTKVMLANFGGDTITPSLQALAALRKAGVAAELYPDTSKMRKQFSYANNKGIPYLLLIGAQEVESGVYQLKNMQTGEQVALPFDEILSKLKLGN
ncbi:MAG: histidine--tRNA ligase [Bacteroidota bacterium]